MVVKNLFIGQEWRNRETRLGPWEKGKEDECMEIATWKLKLPRKMMLRVAMARRAQNPVSSLEVDGEGCGREGSEERVRYKYTYGQFKLRLDRKKPHKILQNNYPSIKTKLKKESL